MRPVGRSVVRRGWSFGGGRHYPQFQRGHVPGSANPNVYTGTAVDTSDPNPGTVGYKYYNSSGLGGNGGWDDGCLNGTSANRPLRLPGASGGTVDLPAVFFGDAGPQQTSPVTFRVNMAQKINVGAFV